MLGNRFHLSPPMEIDKFIENHATQIVSYDETEENRPVIMSDFYYRILLEITSSKYRWKVDVFRLVDKAGSDVRLMLSSKSDKKMGSRMYHMEFNKQFYVIMLSYFDDSFF